MRRIHASAQHRTDRRKNEERERGMVMMWGHLDDGCVGNKECMTDFFFFQTPSSKQTQSSIGPLWTSLLTGLFAAAM